MYLKKEAYTIWDPLKTRIVVPVKGFNNSTKKFNPQGADKVLMIPNSWNPKIITN